MLLHHFIESLDNHTLRTERDALKTLRDIRKAYNKKFPITREERIEKNFYQTKKRISSIDIACHFGVSYQRIGYLERKSTRFNTIRKDIIKLYYRMYLKLYDIHTVTKTSKF